ncbi:FGGY-family carbohydrate kinase (plasmid) [Alkalihalophilus pseudofirmus]|uniref:rhamnulokinase n=1 Tax=Alkalihalophilus pseudofirmus TaxID=79885 RepID=UPI00259BD791|nr:FGGY-family carbohydrate kinase [Alkalihalophilus pseudofirmus]WEG19229.1 FGGY-family carbohydrate kinase [Alkalihalophilus pseudofirmus]
MKSLLACDLGASNGRIVAGLFDGNKIRLNEIYRFPNKYVKENSHYYWDFNSITTEISAGIEKAEQILGYCQKSIGFDTWGVDFGLIDCDKKLVSKPFSYRDTFTRKYLSEVSNRIEDEVLFQKTGNEVNSINTLFQLYAINKEFPDYLQEAKSILFMPNLLAYFYSDIKVNEFTISSTSQLLSWVLKSWDSEIINCLFDIPLPLEQVKMPHLKLGKMKKGYIQSPVDVILVPGHDTACAISALPMNDSDSAFISLGTWGVIGKITEQPVITKEVFDNDFTNEGTSEGKWRLQKNAMGFWILQCLKKEWGNVSYEKETAILEVSTCSRMWIDPDHSIFFNPTSMTDAINQFCSMTGQPMPSSLEEYIRCIVESMALNFGYLINKIEQLSSSKVHSVYMGGGGIQNKSLCQFLSNATGRVVITGPIEASVLGNTLSQLRAQNEINSLEEGKEIVRHSIKETIYTPRESAYWNEVIGSFRELLESKGDSEYANR